MYFTKALSILSLAAAATATTGMPLFTYADHKNPKLTDCPQSPTTPATTTATAPSQS